MNIYQRISSDFIRRIEKGFFKESQKLPSIRQVSEEYRVSINTAKSAYYDLVKKGYAYSKYRSGYYACFKKTVEKAEIVHDSADKTEGVKDWTCSPGSGFDKEPVLKLGQTMPNIDASSMKPLGRIFSDVSKRRLRDAYRFEDLEGSNELRSNISVVMTESGCDIHPDEIIITMGCQQAITLCLQSVVKKGDMVAVDSPGYYGSIQSMRILGLEVVEIPSKIGGGIDLDALKIALDEHPIKAIKVSPTVNNPVGHTMPFDNKVKLIELAERYHIPIIEADVYGDLSYSYPRPQSLKSLDQNGTVLYCSSFSKTVAPGLRIGWVVPGSYFDKVRDWKSVSTSSTPGLAQICLAKFIEQGYYRSHLSKIRCTYANNQILASQWIKKYFPKDTVVYKPTGGFVMWVELPFGIDSHHINMVSEGQGVFFTHGVLFGSADNLRRFIRVNYSNYFQDSLRIAIKTIGKLIMSMDMR